MRVWCAAESATHPWVLEYFGECGPYCRVCDEHPGEEMLALWHKSVSTEDVRRNRRTSTEPDGVLYQSAFDLGMECRHALVVKRYFSTDENIEDDPKTPYVDLWPGVHLCIQ